MDPRIQAMIARLRSADGVYRPELGAQHITYQFEVEDAGIWRLIYDAGTLHLADGPGEADTVLSCDADDFVGVLRGERNLVTAVLQGRVGVRGNLAMAFQLSRLIAPAPLVPAAEARSDA